MLTSAPVSTKKETVAEFTISRQRFKYWRESSELETKIDLRGKFEKLEDGKVL